MKLFHFIRFTLSVLLVSMFLIIPTIGAKEFNATHDQLMTKLETLTPGNSINVLLAAEKETYNTNETFELRFKVSEACYIVLMHISTEGDITFFAPSYWIPEKVEGDKVYSISEFGLPIQVTTPGGIETINLFCSKEKMELFKADLSQKNEFYMIQHDEEEKLQDLARRLDQLDAQEWSGSGIVVQIKDPEGITRALPGVLVPPIGTTGSTGHDRGILFPPIGTTGTTGHSDNP